MALVGIGMLVLHTWTAQSTASVKSQYLLQLAPIAGVFFAQGTMLLHGPVRRAALALALIAAAVAAVVFTEGVVFRSGAPGGIAWLAWARQLPGAHIAEAVLWFLPPGPRPR
jgi:hypothetical protein